MEPSYFFPIRTMDKKLTTASATSQAEKEYVVFGECMSPVSQTVRAKSPEEAIRIADENPDGWELPEFEDNEYGISGEVFDVEADEMIDTRDWTAEPANRDEMNKMLLNACKVAVDALNQIPCRRLTSDVHKNTYSVCSMLDAVIAKAEGK